MRALRRPRTVISAVVALLAANFFAAPLAQAGIYNPTTEYTNGVTVTVVFAHVGENMSTVCAEQGVTLKEGYVVLACGDIGGQRRIWLSNPCEAAYAGESYAEIACHEMAHANGWRHPDYL